MSNGHELSQSGERSGLPWGGIDLGKTITKVTTRHREIMRRLIAGETQRNIAIAMDFTEGRLSIIVNSPLFQRELDALESQIADRIILKAADLKLHYKRDAHSAYRIQKELMEDPTVDPRVRVAVASEIQDRAGYQRHPTQVSRGPLIVISNINRGGNGASQKTQITVAQNEDDEQPPAMMLDEAVLFDEDFDDRDGVIDASSTKL